MTKQRTIFAAILAALLMFGCDTASTPTNTQTDTVVADAGPKADNPDQLPVQVETTLVISLQYPIIDGDLQIAIYPVGTSPTKVSWTTVTEGNTSFVIDVFVGDVYVIWLRYGDFSNSQTIHVDAEDKTFVVNVNSALGCAQYAEIEDYAWTCEGTNIEDENGYYVVEKNGQCYLQKLGSQGSSPQGSYWIYESQGKMSIALCSDPDCWSNCIGTPMLE